MTELIEKVQELVAFELNGLTQYTRRSLTATTKRMKGMEKA